MKPSPVPVAGGVSKIGPGLHNKQHKVMAQPVLEGRGPARVQLERASKYSMFTFAAGKHS